MRDGDVDLYTFERLRAEFGPFTRDEATDGLGHAQRDLIGSRYRETVSYTHLTLPTIYSV